MGCVTGFRKREYYLSDSEIWGLNLEETLVFFLQKIKKSLKETINSEIIVKPGLVKIPFIGTLKGQYKTLTDATILASIETYIPLLIHIEHDLNVEWFSRYLEEKGIKPATVVYYHINKRPDIGLHERLLKKTGR